MSQSEDHPDVSIYFSEGRKGEMIVSINGRMDHKTASHLITTIRSKVRQTSISSLLVQLDDVSYFDDYGALVLNELQEIMKISGGQLIIEDPHHKTETLFSFIDLKDFQPPALTDQMPHDNFISRVGQSTIDYLLQIRSMVSFVGSVFLALSKAFFNLKSLRVSDTIVEMEKTGVNALPIVSLISYLLGLVIAFMSSLQLAQFGANIYVASLVSIAMVSELSPIMTAIVVAGRSGSAFAAEIGTMKIYEEVDALTTMGFDPVLFLAIPRMIAAMIVVPILTLFSGFFGIMGGLTVGLTLLNLTSTSYISQSLETLNLFEILWGMSKSVVFAAIISWVGCLKGFQARGGADAVGNAATSAVVGGIFLIILFDSFFAILRSYLW